MGPEGQGGDWLEARLSRRRVLRGALAGGGLLAAGGLVAACGDSDDGTTSSAASTAPPASSAAPAETTAEATSAATTASGETSAAATTAAETAPATTAAAAGPGVKGGTIRYSSESPPSGFDPAKWWNQLSWDGSMLVNEPLIELKQDGSIAPRLLADLPEANADGTLYTFTLRDGVTFSDGTPLTAEDVKFSLERLLNPATASEGASLYTSLPIPGLQDLLDEKADTLSGITVVDPTTLTIALDEPRSVFLYVLGLPFAAIVPMKYAQEAGDKFNFAPLGTGPYVIKDVDQSRSITWERNPAYWAADQRGWADTIEWEIGVAPDLAVLRVQRGELDLMSEPVPAELIAQLQGDATAKDLLEIGVANNVHYFTLSLKQPELQDVRVRQAIAHAVDKERLVRAVKGMGEVANGGLFSPASPYFQDGIAYPFDPDRAKALLAEAGHGDGFSVTFWSANWAPYKEMAQTVKQDLEAVGIKVDAKVLIREQYLAEVVKNPAGLTNNEWELPYPHGSYVMDGAFTQAAIDAGCCNFSEFKSDEFDALAAEANRELDDARLVDLYKQMDTMVVKDEALWVPMIYPKFPKIHSAQLKGYSVPATPSASVNYLADYWIEA